MNIPIYSLKAFALLFVIIVSKTAFAAESYIYSNGQKLPLEISKEKISIKFKSGILDSEIDILLSKQTVLGERKPLRTASGQNFFTIGLKSQADIQQLLQNLRQKPEVEIVNPVYSVGGVEAIPYDHFVVRFKPTVTTAEIEALNTLNNVETVRVSTATSNLYTLRVTGKSDLSVLEMANLYYESLPTDWSVPDMIVPIELCSTPNDTYFNNQYYLHNTGQTGGVMDADIDALEAWDISMGSSEIVVAVIDEGGSAHEDLPASRIVSGYDFIPPFDSDPSPGGNQAHGMACAGIIAASQNNGLGVTGVAPNCKIMPLRIYNEYGEPASVANTGAAIDYAWQHGADVISNSWAIAVLDPYVEPFKTIYAPILIAIDSALTQGRGGKGCVVVAAAGNFAARPNYLDYVRFPANVTGVLAVGATDKSNNIQDYSPADDELDVVAPSGMKGEGLGLSDEICDFRDFYNLIKLHGDVWTLDIGGAPGYNPGNYGICDPTNFHRLIWDSPGGDPPNPGNYTAHFGGTSAACPQAAAVAALILSVNDQLSESEVRDIIKGSANDMGPTGYDTDYGYGRINAYEALKYTLRHYGGTLSGDVVLTEKLVVEDGTLTIEPGTTIKFEGTNTGINVQPGGKIVAAGTASEPITFTSNLANPSRGAWGTFYVFSSNNRLEYCTIEYADIGVKIHGNQSFTTGNVLQNCTFRENDQAIRLDNSEVTVENCTIEDNRHAYVILDNADVTIRDNLVQHNDRDGIYAYGSVIDLFSNRFEYNGEGDVSTYHGIYAGSGDDISLGSRDIDPNPNMVGGFNTIRNNRGAGILVNYGATVKAGEFYVPLQEYTAGSNSLHDNGTKSGTCAGKDIYNSSGTTIKAHYNYWGGNCPPASSQIYGSVDASYCLSASPTGYIAYNPDDNPLMAKASSETNSNHLAQSSDSDTQIKKDLIANYKTIIAAEPGRKSAEEALWRYYSLVRTDRENKLAERSVVLSYLNDVYNANSNIESGKIALQLLILEQRRLQNLKEAITLSETALKELTGDSRAGVLFNLVFIELATGDLKRANESVVLYKTDYPKNESEIAFLEESVEQASDEVEETVSLSKTYPEDGTELSNRGLENKENIVLELSPNYPNPFNPETTIRYEIPHTSHVEITIFNLLGKEIRTLVSGVQSEGKYTIHWDGKDRAGRNMASGVYLARITAGTTSKTVKMTLVR